MEEVDSTWRKARKRPVVIDVRGPITAEEKIDTREGALIAAPGYYIIRGGAGRALPDRTRRFL